VKRLPAFASAGPPIDPEPDPESVTIEETAALLAARKAALGEIVRELKRTRR
jgi:hypothetical protein